MHSQCRELLVSQLDRLRRTPTFRGKWEMWLQTGLIVLFSACAVNAEGAFFRFSALTCGLLTSIGLTMRICILESSRSTQRLIEALIAADEPPTQDA